jgi:hypothetical protein
MASYTLWNQLSQLEVKLLEYLTSGPKTFEELVRCTDAGVEMIETSLV